MGISASGPFPRDACAYAHKNISRNCSAARNLGDSTYTENHSGSGIVLSNVDGATVVWSTAHSNGWHQASHGGGPVGIWAWEACAVVIRHCAAWNNSNGVGQNDGGGFDLDGGVTDSVVLYSASWANTGAGSMIYQFTGASALTNNIVRFCLSIGGGYDARNSGGLELFPPTPSTPATLTYIGNTIFTGGIGGRIPRGRGGGSSGRKVNFPSTVHFFPTPAGLLPGAEVSLRRNAFLQPGGGAAAMRGGPLILVGWAGSLGNNNSNSTETRLRRQRLRSAE